MTKNIVNKKIIFVAPTGVAMYKYALQMTKALKALNIGCNILKVTGKSHFTRLIFPLFTSRRLLYCQEKIIYVHYIFFQHYIFLLPFLILSKIIFKKKIIIQIHEYRKYLPFKNMVQYVDLLYCKIANKIILHNDEQYNELKKYGFKNLELLYMPIDDCNIKENKIINPKKIKILMHGFILRKKGYEIGIKALKVLPKNYMMTFIGLSLDKTYFKELMLLIKNLKLEQRINFINKFLPEKECNKAIKESDIIIYPYIISTASAALTEGALKFEKPFITSNVPSFVKYIGSNDYSFKSGDHIDLSEKILNIDFQGSKKLCIALKKKYSRENAGKKIVKIAEFLH